jgi:molecular chaperone GrpE
VSREETLKSAGEVPNAEAEAAAETPAAESVPEVSAEQLAAAQRQAQEYLASWQRERADFSNFKKRAERELKESAQNGAADALLKLLPIFDDFDRAFAHIPAELKDNPWIEGVQGINRKFQKLLDDQGISVIDPLGQPFDPSRHEAVGMDYDSEMESGHITATLQKGYVRGERVLRPALVRVAN